MVRIKRITKFSLLGVAILLFIIMNYPMDNKDARNSKHKYTKTHNIAPMDRKESLLAKQKLWQRSLSKTNSKQNIKLDNSALNVTKHKKSNQNLSESRAQEVISGHAQVDMQHINNSFPLRLDVKVGDFCAFSSVLLVCHLHNVFRHYDRVYICAHT